MQELIITASGTRGLVNENFPPEIATTIAQAFATMQKKGSIIVGGDTRSSYPIYKEAVIKGLTCIGLDVIDIGQCPTPTCQQLIRHTGASGAAVITASHNPIEYNGIKLMNDSGSFLNDDEFKTFKAIYDQKEFTKVPENQIGNVTKIENAIDIHIDKILAAIDTRDIKNTSLKVLSDPNNGAGALAVPKLFERLGINATIINATPDGNFSHPPEPLKQNITSTIDAMKSGIYDIAFIQDPDADRLVILDETGHFIGEDYSLAYCLDYILSENNTPNPDIVVNLSTSKVIEDLATKYGAKTHYTKIGETHVTQGLKKLNALAGGEGNGGVIYPKVGWGRDSLTGIVLALKHRTKSQKPVSETIATYPKYTLLRDKITVSNRDEIKVALEKIDRSYQNQEKDTQDGLKITLENAWIHVRPSNTEPILRIFTEAPSEKEAKKLIDNCKETILQ